MVIARQLEHELEVAELLVQVALRVGLEQTTLLAEHADQTVFLVGDVREGVRLLVAVRFVADQPVFVVAPNRALDRQGQLVVDAGQLLVRRQFAFFVRAALQNRDHLIVDLVEGLRDHVLCAASCALEAELDAFAVLDGVRLDDRLADRLVLTGLISGSAKEELLAHSLFIRKR